MVIEGIGTGTSHAIRLSDAGAIHSGGNASITVIADSLHFDGVAYGSINSGAGTTTLIQRTAGTLIDIGGADILTGSTRTLGLTDAELDRITAGLVQIGNAASGNITVSAAITHGNNLSLVTGGSITFNSSVTIAADRNFSAQSLGNHNNITLASTDAGIDVSGSGTVTISSTRNIALVAGSTVTSADGAVVLRGNAGTGDTNTSAYFGVAVIGGGIVRGGAIGGVVVEGIGAMTDFDGNQGVRVWGTGSQITSYGGAVLVDGTGGGAEGSNENYGVYVLSGAAITNAGTAASASVTVTGRGGSTTSPTVASINNHGVHVLGAGARISSAGGPVLVEGRGGGSASGQANHGVSIVDSGTISSTGATLDATVNVIGFGGETQGNSNFGVNLLSNAVITSSGGAILVEGTGGGRNDSGNNVGVYLQNNSTINSSSVNTSATVTVIGQGGNLTGSSGLANIGVWVGGSQVSSSGGAVLVEGTGGGSGASGGNVGVRMLGGGTITSESLDAPVTVIGVGGNGPSAAGQLNHGVFISQSPTRITSSGGEIEVRGTAGEGIGPMGIAVYGFGQINGTAAGTTVRLIADRIDFDEGPSVNAGGNTVFIQTETAGRIIQLGSTSNATQLGLTNADLNLIVAGTLVIGNADSSAITITNNVLRQTATNMQLISGGDILFNGGQVNTAGGTLLLSSGNSPAAIRPTFSGTDVIASQLSMAGDLAIVINGTAANTQYTQLFVSGIVDLAGVDLVLSGTYTPDLGENFIIVNNDNTDAIIGTFNGLVEGDTLDFNGESFTITYIGGDGNDVSLSRAVDAASSFYAFAATSIVEGNSITVNTTSVRVIRSGDTTTATSVDVSIASGGPNPASSGTDFLQETVTIDFAVGETEKFVPITVYGDSIVELDETLLLTFVSFSVGGQSLDTDSVVVTILDDDTATLFINSVTVDENAGTATLRVTLDNAVDTGFTVDFTTVDDTAIAGEDYTATSGTAGGSGSSALMFTGTAGEFHDITIDITNDNVVEAVEMFLVSLSNVQADGRDVRIAAGGGEVTIIDNDSATFTIEDVSVNEGDGIATFIISLVSDSKSCFAVGS